MDIDDILAKAEGGNSAPEERPEWLTKKKKPAADDVDNILAKAEEKPAHSLDSLSADIAKGKAALSQPTALESGVNAVGTLATNALDAPTLGMYSKARNAIGGLISPEAAASTQDAEQQFDEAHPFLANSARAVGNLAPWGAGARAAQAAEAGLGAATRNAPELARRILTSRPVAGALVGGATNAAVGGAQDALDGGDVVGNLPGNALTGAAVGGAVGAASAGYRKAATNLVDNARARATKDIGKDIVAAEGPRARVTDQKRIAEVNDRLFDLTNEQPELRKAWRKSAEKALPEIEAAKRAAAEPLDRTYDAVDKLTEGGIRLGDIVDGFEEAAKEAGAKASGQPQAARLRSVKDNFIKAYGEPKFDPSVPINEEGTTAGQALKMLERAKVRGADVDEQIAQLKKTASSGVDLEKRIPTAQFREEVTDLHKTAESAMGGIEGSARHEALNDLYRTGKDIIDGHLDGSRLPAEQLAELRKANDRYFLLSRAEAAVASRGWKESNRHTGFAHSAAQAVDSGSIPAMGVYAAMHPSHIPAMLATYGAVKAAPAIASRANWALAQRAPGSMANAGASLNPAAVARLIQAARGGATPQQLTKQAEDDGLPPDVLDQLATR